MSTAASQIAAGRSRKTDWHRFRLWATIAAACILVLAVGLDGYHYYSLDTAQRVASPLRAQFRSSGTIGRALGMVSGVLFLLLFLYPIRKRWKWLGRKGNTRHWLDFHIVLGLTAPAVVTLHSSFRLNGVAGLAYWIMLAVVVSGIAGRYLYAQIPRRLDAAEMSLNEIQAASARLAEEIRDRHAVGVDALLVELPTAERVQALPLWQVLWLMLVTDLRRPVVLWSLRRRARGTVAKEDLHEAVTLLKMQAVLAKRLVFLSRTQQVFQMWHVVHRPFSYSFVVLSSLHVMIVLLLGY